MLTLFLRAIFLDLFVLLILRLTGKRQVSDLQPYDLLMTLIIAAVSAAIATVMGEQVGAIRIVSFKKVD